MATLARIKSRKGAEYEGNLGVMILMFVIMGGIIYYAIIASPSEKAKIGINLEKFSREYIDASPGLVKGAPATSTETGLHQMQDAVVDGRAVEKITELRPEVRLTKNALSGQAANISVSLNLDAVQAVSITGTVQSGDNPADLVVRLNGHEVTRLALKVGRQFFVELPSGQLSTQNSVELGLETQSLFRGASYTLSNINLVTRAYDSSKAGVQRSFTLTDAESSGLKSATLTAYVRSLTGDAGRLTIEINGNQIYNDFPLQELRLKLPVSYLKAGQNNLLFEVTKGGAYGMGFVEANTEFGREPTIKSKDYKFTASNFVIGGIAANRMACPLIVQSQLPKGEVTAHLNTAEFTGQLVNTTTTIDVCRGFKAGDNTLFLTASQDVYISRLTLGVREK